MPKQEAWARLAQELELTDDNIQSINILLSQGKEDVVRRALTKRREERFPGAFKLQPADETGAMPGVLSPTVKYDPTGKELPAEPVEPQTPRQQAMAEVAKEVGPLQALMIGTGKGFYNVARGVGIADPAGEAETEAIAALKEERPYTTGAGEIVGEASPFLIPGMGASKIASLPLRVIASGIVGGAEGGIISKGVGSDATMGAGMGAGIGVGAEILFPVLGKLGRKIFQRVRGKAPVGAVLDAAGKPTKELTEALEAVGMSFDDLTDDAVELITKQKPGAKPEQVARKARFDSEGVPITKGELIQGSPGGYKQQAIEQRLLESSQDTAAEPFRQYKLQQSEAIKKNLKTSLGFDVGDVKKKEMLNEETGSLTFDALTGRKKLLRTQKNELYKESAENAEELGGVMIFNDGIKEAIPDKATMRRLSRVEGNQIEALEDLLVEFGISENPDAIKKFIKSGGEVMPLSIKNFEEFNQGLKRLIRADQGGATAVVGGPIRDALSHEIDNLVETLTNSSGLKVHKSKLVDIDRLHAELDNNSKIIGFIKKRVKAESIAPDTEAMKKALKERGVPVMQQNHEGEKEFANRIKGDFQRIFKSDPILKKTPGQTITDPDFQKLTTRNAEITQIINQSSSKIPKEIVDNVLRPLKEARAIVRTIKTEFSPQSAIGRIVDTKKDGFTQISEASKFYDKMVGRASPVEDTRKFIKSLSKSGEKGKQAIASLQASTIMDLIDVGFGTESRKISGIKVFNPIAFKNRLKAIGPNKMKSIFANEKQILKKLNNIEKIAGELVPPSGAVPKGSATYIMDLANTLGLTAISHKMPGGALLLGALKTLGDPIKTGRTVKEALKATPEIADLRTLIGRTFPGMSSALGIAATVESEEK